MAKKIKRINKKAEEGKKKINGRYFYKGKLVIREENIKKVEDPERKKELREFRKWRIPGAVYASDIDLETGLPNEKLPEELKAEIIQKKKEIIKINYDDLTADDPEDIIESLETQLHKKYGIEKPKAMTKKILKNLQWLAGNAFVPEEDFEIVLKAIRLNSGRSLIKKSWQDIMMVRYLQDSGLGIEVTEGIATLFTQLGKSFMAKFAISDVAMSCNQDTWYLDHLLIIDKNVYEIYSRLLDYKQQPKPKRYLQITKNGQIKTKKSKEDKKAEKKASKKGNKKESTDSKED